MKTYLCEVETKDQGHGSRIKTIRVKAADMYDAFIKAHKCLGVEDVIYVIKDLSDVIAKRINSNPFLTKAQHEFVMEHYREAYGYESDEWVTVCPNGSDFKYGRYKIDTNKMLRRALTFAEFYSGGIVD